MLVQALLSYGHEVRTAHDGLEALHAAEAFRPDIALIDIGLPVMDGFEVARRMTEHPGLSSTQLVAVTGYGQEQDRERSASAGFVRHLVKPVDLEELRTLVELSTQGLTPQ
jgi:CheY-like chemotaxis protein